MIQSAPRLRAAVLFVAVLLLGVPATAGVSSAQEPSPTASDPAEAVHIALTNVRPAVPKADGVVRLRGTIRNTGTTPVTDVQVLVRVSPTPLAGRFEIGQVAANESLRQGNAVFSTLTSVAPELSPDSQIDFALTVPVSELALGGNGVYAVFVEGLGQLDGLEQSFGRAPTLLPWFPDGDGLSPSQLVFLWPVSAPVPQGVGAAMVNDDLAVGMAPGGSLYNRVEVGRGAPIPLTWLIDPALVTAANTMIDGYSVDGVPADSAGSAAAGAWASLLRQAIRTPSHTSMVMPFAGVDAEALTRNGVTDLIDTAVRLGTAAQRSLGAQGVIAAPPNGASTRATLAEYLGSGVGSILLADEFLPTRDNLTYTPTGLGSVAVGEDEMTAVLLDTGLADTLPTDAADEASLLMARQSFLAQSAMITLEAPGVPRTAVVQPAAAFGADADWTRRLFSQLSRAAWTEVVPLSDLLALDANQQAPRRWENGGRGAELPPDYIASLPPLQQRSDALETVLVNPGETSSLYDEAFIRAASSQWRDAIADGRAVLASIDADLAASEQSVKVISAGRVTLSGDTGSLPLTIANDLDRSVEVGLRLEATPSQRLEYVAPLPQTIQAGRRVSIEVPVRVVGSGVVPVDVWLLNNADGTFGPPQRIELNSTATATIAAIVAVVGGSLLVLLVIARFIRTTRARSHG